METPVAAPAAAPAAPSPAAPSPSPAATPAPAAPVAAPEAPAAAPASPAEPAAPPAAAPAAEPTRADFPQTAEGIESFLKAHNAWEDTQGEQEFVTGDEVPTDETKPAEEVVKPADAETKPEEKPAEAKPSETEAPTPEGLSKILEAHPDLKAAIEAAPEAKGAIYAMARQNAKAAPILEIFPNAESAKFAATNASEFVGLKTAIQLADTPEKMADASTMFLDQFKVVDDKGQLVLDAKGQPTYGDDLPMFVDHIKAMDRTTRIADLKARIDANQYINPSAKDNDEQLLSAYEFISAAEAAGPDAADKPDTSTMTPEQKAYFDKKEAELQAERDRLGIKDKEMSKKQVAQVREQNRTEYRKQFGGSVGKYLGNYLKQKEADGAVIPRYLVSMIDKGTGVSVFAKTVMDKLDEKLDSLAGVKAHSATLEMNAINPDGLAARVKYGQDRVDEFLPDIIDSLLKEAGVSTADDAKRAADARDGARKDARAEPSSTGPGSPKHMTDQQLMAQAYKNVDAKYPSLDDRARIEKALQERDRLQFAAA